MTAAASAESMATSSSMDTSNPVRKRSPAMSQQQPPPDIILTSMVESDKLHPTTTSSRPSSSGTDTGSIRMKNKRHPSYHYQPRMSALDRERLALHQDPFRGFFTLFWLTMAIYVLLTFLHNVEHHGVLLTGQLWTMFTVRVGGLFLSDLGMLVSMMGIFVWEKYVVANGWMPWRWLELVVQHTFQAAFLFVWLGHCLVMNWSFVQTSFFTLHTMAMLMKIHSFGDKNSYFQRLEKQSQKLKSDLDALEKRVKGSDGAECIMEYEKVATMWRAVEEELQPDLSVQRYPKNLTVENWIDFMLAPTLVYELYYPRTAKIRREYVFEKAVAMVGTFGLLYVTVEHYVLPTMRDNPHAGFFALLPSLLIPFLLCYLLSFYLVFECILNLAAEVTRFADRNFYDDWWNSVNWDEFARKWNKPVHTFLLRHVYIPLHRDLHMSKSMSTFLTFFLSSLVHELAVAVIIREVRWYFFFIQMSQLPLVWMANKLGKVWKDHFGNAFFWVGMMVGPAMLTYVYTWKHFHAS